MDPVVIGAVLLAIVSGASEAIGTQLWAGVVALVGRPFRHHHAGAEVAMALPTGREELAALERAPTDERRAVALAEVLVARAGADAEFGRAMEGWWEQASPIRADCGGVANTITGGIQHGPVLMGRDFSNITFGAAPPTSPVSPPEAHGA
jgi:hypothetical protein